MFELFPEEGMGLNNTKYGIPGICISYSPQFIIINHY